MNDNLNDRLARAGGEIRALQAQIADVDARMKRLDTDEARVKATELNRHLVAENAYLREELRRAGRSLSVNPCGSFTNCEVAPGLCELCHEPESEHQHAEDRRERYAAAMYGPVAPHHVTEEGWANVDAALAVSDEETSSLRAKLERVRALLDNPHYLDGDAVNEVRAALEGTES